MCHQRTELPTNRHNKKRRPISKQRHHKAPENQVTGQVKKHYDNMIVHNNKDQHNKCQNSISSTGISMPWLRNTNVKYVTNMVIFQVFVTKRRIKLTTRKLKKSKGASTECRPSVCARQVCFAVILKNQVLMSTFACSCKYNEMKLRVRRFLTMFTL